MCTKDSGGRGLQVLVLMTRCNMGVILRFERSLSLFETLFSPRGNYCVDTVEGGGRAKEITNARIHK